LTWEPVAEQSRWLVRLLQWDMTERRQIVAVVFLVLITLVVAVASTTEGYATTIGPDGSLRCKYFSNAHLRPYATLSAAAALWVAKLKIRKKTEG
jgi:hypothetical protein